MHPEPGIVFPPPPGMDTLSPSYYVKATIETCNIVVHFHSLTKFKYNVFFCFDPSIKTVITP